MQGYYYEKKDGRVTKTETSVPLCRATGETRLGHLCFDCENGYINKCLKIRDDKKQNIEAYPFIIDGIQIRDEHDKLIEFTVKKCKNFKEEIDELSQPERTKLLREKVFNLYSAYLGVNSIEEFDQDFPEKSEKIKKLNRNSLFSYCLNSYYRK